MVNLKNFNLLIIRFFNRVLEYCYINNSFALRNIIRIISEIYMLENHLIINNFGRY